MRLRAVPAACAVAAALVGGCVPRGRSLLRDDARPDPLPPETIARPIAHLPAPHRETAPRPPSPRAPTDLRGWIGWRDRSTASAPVIAWARQLGGLAGVAADASIDDVLIWAEQRERLAGALYPPEPGDLLVFDRVHTDEDADLLAIAIARDARGVVEMIYVAGGVVRRGFVDPVRRAVHRDAAGATRNTYLRHAKRWPPHGTRYLAGELLAHVIRAR